MNTNFKEFDTACEYLCVNFIGLYTLQKIDHNYARLVRAPDPHWPHETNAVTEWSGQDASMGVVTKFGMGGAIFARKLSRTKI